MLIHEYAETIPCFIVNRSFFLFQDDAQADTETRRVLVARGSG